MRPKWKSRRKKSKSPYGNVKTTTEGWTTEDNARGRFGIKASEDLGGGLTAIAKYEWKADTTDNKSGGNIASVDIAESIIGSDLNGDGDSTDIVTVNVTSDASLTSRESYVGLKGGFGTIMLGNLKSPL